MEAKKLHEICFKYFDNDDKLPLRFYVDVIDEFNLLPSVERILILFRAKYRKKYVDISYTIPVAIGIDSDFKHLCVPIHNIIYEHEYFDDVLNYKNVQEPVAIDVKKIKEKFKDFTLKKSLREEVKDKLRNPFVLDENKVKVFRDEIKSYVLDKVPDAKKIFVRFNSEYNDNWYDIEDPFALVFDNNMKEHIVELGETVHSIIENIKYGEDEEKDFFIYDRYTDRQDLCSINHIYNYVITL